MDFQWMVHSLVGAGSQTLCLPCLLACLLACFYCDFWLCCCCCSLMVVAPTNLGSTQLGVKVARRFGESSHSFHTTYIQLLLVTTMHIAWLHLPYAIKDKNHKNHLSLSPSLSLFLQHWKMTF